MGIPNLSGLVARLDGICGESGSLERELNSIALPPLFRNDLADWLNVDLLRLSLTETELDLIRNRDMDYVSMLRRRQREQALLLKASKDKGSLATAPGVVTSPARKTHRALERFHGARAGERAEMEKEFCEQVRAEFGHPDAGLYAFLGSTVEHFIWRPTLQHCRVWLAEDDARAEVEHLIGATMKAANGTFLEIAYYWGILYHVFLSDPGPSPRVIYTDHETAWRPGYIHDAGPLDEFLSEFLSVDEAVDLVARELG